MSLLLKLKENFSDKQTELNQAVNEYTEKIDGETENEEKDVGKARVDIDIQALANTLQYICHFDYIKKHALYSNNSEVIGISLDKNIVIETIDSHIIDYNRFVEATFPIIKLRIYIDDIKVKFLVLKRNINYEWEIDVQDNIFPMSHGVINFINKWSEDQLNKKREIEKLKEDEKKQKEQEKLNKLIEVYEKYKKYEE